MNDDHGRHQAIQEHVSNIAGQMGMSLTSIEVIDGISAGVIGVYLVKMYSKNGQESILVYQTEYCHLLMGKEYGSIESRLRAALGRLRERCHFHG